MDKSGRKSGQKRVTNPKGTPANLIPGKGRGPAKGQPNAGRPPDEWRERLRAMASRDEVLNHVSEVLLAGPDHPYFDRALQYATDHGYGRPKQDIGLSGTLTLESLLAQPKP